MLQTQCWRVAALALAPKLVQPGGQPKCGDVHQCDDQPYYSRSSRQHVGFGTGEYHRKSDDLQRVVSKVIQKTAKTYFHQLEVHAARHTPHEISQTGGVEKSCRIVVGIGAELEQRVPAEQSQVSVDQK